jgi:hypothetical protein
MPLSRGFHTFIAIRIGVSDGLGDYVGGSFGLETPLL